MDTEDYFGEIAVPQDEEEEDAANDLTFGNIDDVKPGDDDDSVWKTEQTTLADQIEAEREAIQRQRLQEEHQIFLAAKSQGGISAPMQNGHVSLEQVPSEPVQQESAAWQLLKSLQQSSQPQPAMSAQSAMSNPHVPMPHSAIQHIPQTLPRHPHVLRQHSTQQSLQHGPTTALNGHPVQQHLLHTDSRLRPQKLHPQLHLHQLAQRHAQQSIPVTLLPQAQEYQRMLVTQQEQKTRLLLQQHMNTAEQQLREAERAQQAGMRFDRKEFDRHQEAARQAIFSDHYNRVQQVQFHVWQANEQLRHAAGQTRPQVQKLDLQRTVQLPVGPSPQSSPPLARSPVDNEVLNHVATTQGHVLYKNAHSANTANGNTDNRGHEPEKPSLANVKERLSSLKDEDLKKEPRMLEIERQMAAAGLGPTTTRETWSQRKALRGTRRDVDVSKTSSRRLESMTDKDQELVFRAHLRQIDSTVVYKDDYYNHVIKKKERFNTDEVFSDLAKRAQALRIREKERTASGLPLRIRGKRTAKNSKGDQPAASSPGHSDQNMRALANALGTVQSWNPRAPRRVMDFSLIERKEPIEGDEKSLGEDERVHVRQEVERGYDMIATIHDIARGESQQSMVGSMKSLFSTLHLAGPTDGESLYEGGKFQSTHFFATMCVIQKGRRYLANVLELLEIEDCMHVLSAIFENLGMVVFASQKSREKNTSVPSNTHGNLFSVMTKIIQENDTQAADCLHLFDSFCGSHIAHHDAFLTTFRSSIGSKLIFLCMQKISAGMQQLGEEETLKSGHVQEFTSTFSRSLKDIFDGAESISRVWEVAASLDALARGPSRTKYRSELNRLVRSGELPPPPS